MFIVTLGYGGEHNFGIATFVMLSTLFGNLIANVIMFVLGASGRLI